MPREIQTAVQIANMALRILQSQPIESFVEDTLPAQTVRMYYDNVLRCCIAVYPWSFSLQEKQLQQLPASPVPRWKYVYHLPADFVCLVWLRSGASNCNIRAYEFVSGDLLLTDAAPPRLGSARAYGLRPWRHCFAVGAHIFGTKFSLGTLTATVTTRWGFGGRKVGPRWGRV